MDHTNLSPTDIFSGHHDYELFLLHKEIDAPNGNLNHQDTHNCENQDDILIHAAILSNLLHYPNCWQNTTVKTWIPLILQAQLQPLFRLLVIKPSTLCVFITHWQPSATNLSTLTLTTTLQYHNSWHNPTLNTRITLKLQVQCQPLSKPPVITPSIPNLLIT